MPRYHAKSDVPWSCQQMFDLVADVESYPAFVPWWVEARITGKKDDLYQTCQTMGIGPVRLQFNSSTRMTPFSLIQVDARGGGLKNLHLVWRFTDLSDNTPGCLVDLDMTLVMANRPLEILVSRLSRNAARTLVDAFVCRARTLYGHKRN